MYQWRHYPWTNFNELNLDWIMRLLKEIQVDAIPALDEKIDNVYDYITENLSEIVGQLATVIYNVKWSGAVGDGATDDSAAITDAFTKSNYIYFPKGTYCFKNIVIDKPVIVFGDGDETIFQPIRKSGMSNQTYTMITFNKSVDLSGIQIKPEEPLAVESGTKYYIEAAIVAENANHVHFHDITMDRIFQAYHTSWANPVLVPFEDRNGMAFYIHSCDDVCLNDCKVIDFGGEELIIIAQDRINFARGTVKVTNCKFSKTTYATGSVINIIGGKVVCSDNIIDNFIGCWDNPPTTGGTIMNVCGNTTVFADNTFHNCLTGNYVDFGEGYFIKAAEVICTGNIFSGSTHSPVRAFARSVEFSDNYVEGCGGVKCMACTTPFKYTVAGVDYILTPYCEDVNTVYTDYETIDISNNTFIMTAPSYAYGSLASTDAPIAEQSQNTLVTNPPNVKYKKFIFADNDLRFDADCPLYNIIYLHFSHENVIVKNNTIKNAGYSNPAYTDSDGIVYRAIVSGTGYQDMLVISGNIIDGSEVDASEGIVIVSGSSTFRTNSNYNMTYNSGIGSNITDHTGATSSLGSFHANYQDNIIPHA